MWLLRDFSSKSEFAKDLSAGVTFCPKFLFQETNLGAGPACPTAHA